MNLRRSLFRNGIALRMIFAALCLTLMLNGVAYLAHQHKVESGASPATHAELCGFCATFGGLGAAPAAADAPSLTFAFIVVALLSVTAPLLRRDRIAARPRAPPAR